MDILYKIFRDIIRYIEKSIDNFIRFSSVCLFLCCLQFFMGPGFLQIVHAGHTTGTGVETASLTQQDVNASDTSLKNESSKIISGNKTGEDSINSSEIENTLARKALIGTRKTEPDNDRFYTILFYSLSLVTLGLIVVLIYFYTNLNDKGKYLKSLRRRLDKIQLRKPRPGN